MNPDAFFTGLDTPKIKPQPLDLQQLSAALRVGGRTTVNQVESIPQFSDEDRLLDYLITKGLTSLHGVAKNDHELLMKCCLSALSQAGHAKLEAILKKEIPIKLGDMDFGIQTSAFELLAHFNQWLIKMGYPCAGIELVGSGVSGLFDEEFLVNNWKALDVDIKALFSDETFQRLLKKVQSPPSDYDFRILVPKAPNHLLNDYRNEFIDFLLSKMPPLSQKKRGACKPLVDYLKKVYPAGNGVPGRYDQLTIKDPGLARILIREFAFSKLFVPKPQDVNQYAIGTVSNGSDFTLEIMLVIYMERLYMFGHNSLRLPVQPLIEYLQSKTPPDKKHQIRIKPPEPPKLAPVSSLCNGWQGFFDVQTQVITPYHDIKKLDEKDWARYFSGLIKGKHELLPGAVEAMWEKVKDNAKASASLEAHIARLLIECLKGHHAHDPYAAIAVAFHVRLFLKDRVKPEQCEAVMKALREYWESPLLAYPENPHALFPMIKDIVSLKDPEFTAACCLMNAGAFEHLLQAAAASPGSVGIRPVDNNGRYAHAIAIPCPKKDLTVHVPFMSRDEMKAILELFKPDGESFEDFKQHLKILKELYAALKPSVPEAAAATPLQANKECLRPYAELMGEFEEKCAEHPHTLLKSIGYDLMLANQANEDQRRRADTVLKNIPAMFCFEPDKEPRLRLLGRLESILTQKPWNLSKESIQALFAPFQQVIDKGNIRAKNLSIPWIKALGASRCAELCRISYSLWLQVCQRDDIGAKNQSELYRELFQSFLKDGKRNLAISMFLGMHPKDRFNRPQEALWELHEICEQCQAAKETAELTVNISNLGRIAQSLVDVKEITPQNRKPFENPRPLLWLIEKLAGQGQLDLAGDFLAFLTRNKLVPIDGPLAKAWINICESLLNHGNYGIMHCIVAWEKAKTLGVWKSLDGNIVYETFLTRLIERWGTQRDLKEYPDILRILQSLGVKKMSSDFSRKIQEIPRNYFDRLLDNRDFAAVSRDVPVIGRFLPPEEQAAIQLKVISLQIDCKEYADAVKQIGFLAASGSFLSQKTHVATLRAYIRKILEQLPHLHDIVCASEAVMPAAGRVQSGKHLQ